MNFIIRLKETVIKKIFKSVYLPGHFYSTVPEKEDILSFFRNNTIQIDTCLGIDLNSEVQKDHLKKIYQFYSEVCFPEFKVNTSLYYSKNDFFVHSDAIYLYSIIRIYKPCKIIEIGSGFSSAVMIDTFNQIKHKASLTFIDPYPSRLNNVLAFLPPNEYVDYNIISFKVQTIDFELFSDLEENDILFIDSSHVSKIGSDLNYLLFNIIPKLKTGVIIHFHDIFFPFEYPMDWLLEGRNWNECYLLRAFLLFNNSFEILLFNNYIVKELANCIEGMVNLQASGGSLYLKKIN